METIELTKVHSLTSNTFFMVGKIQPLETSGFFEAFCEELGINIQFFKGEDGEFYLENNQ